MPLVPIARNTPVRIVDIHGKTTGYARVDHYSIKFKVVFLDRRVGIYSTYPLDQCFPCNVKEVAKLVEQDIKLDKGDVLHILTRGLP